MSPIAQSSLPNKLDILLRLSALLVLFAGVSLGLFTLSSAVGIWVGAWDFCTGLGILRMANTAAPYLFWSCLALGIATGLFAMFLAHQDRGRLIVYAVIGTAIAALGYAVPESFWSPEGVNYPVIHDITTNTDCPPQFVDILPLRGTESNSVIYGGAENVTAEELPALTKEAYPDLVPRVYDERHADVYRRALNAVETLGWEIVSADFDSRRIEATDTTLWFRFKDDVVITFGTQSSTAAVNARSTSRVGVGDVGANADRLRAFFCTDGHALTL